MAYRVDNHFLKEGNRRVEFIRTIFDDGAFERQPKIIVMHFTYGASGRSSAEWFRDRRNAGSSAHLVVDRDGSVIQCADFKTICWHAGRSRLRDIVGLNHHSIGIEMANWGYLKQAPNNKWKSHTGVAVTKLQIATHKNGNPPDAPSPCGWESYPEPQVASVTEIVKALIDAYGINEIVGHDDISKGRKWDPGPAFDMSLLRARVFGERGVNADNRVRVAAPDGLNLRKGPGTEFDVVELLPLGTVLDPLQREGLWLSVSVIKADGQPRATGWVHSQYVADL